MSQSLSQTHSALSIRMCGNAKCTVPYLSECVVMLQIQSQIYSGIFAEFGNISKSEPNAQCPIYQNVW
jgi:hypothetical protein